MKKIALIKYSLLPKQKPFHSSLIEECTLKQLCRVSNKQLEISKRPLICRQANEFCVFVFMGYMHVCLPSKDRHGKLWKQNNIKMFHYCWLLFFIIFNKWIILTCCSANCGFNLTMFLSSYFINGYRSNSFFVRIAYYFKG